MAFNVQAVYGEDIALDESNKIVVQHVEITSETGRGTAREGIDVRLVWNDRSTKKGFMLSNIEQVKRLIENLQEVVDAGEFTKSEEDDDDGKPVEEVRRVRKKVPSKAAPVTSRGKARGKK